MKKIEAKLKELSEEIADIQASTSVDQKRFDEFVNELTESLKELMPPRPEETVDPLQEVNETFSTD